MNVAGLSSGLSEQNSPEGTAANQCCPNELPGSKRHLQRQASVAHDQAPKVRSGFQPSSLLCMPTQAFGPASGSVRQPGLLSRRTFGTCICSYCRFALSSTSGARRLSIRVLSGRYLDLLPLRRPSHREIEIRFRLGPLLPNPTSDLTAQPSPKADLDKYGCE